MRLSEIIGLQKKKIDLVHNLFAVDEQMPFKLPAGTKIVEKLAPVKSDERILPITKETRPFFESQLELTTYQRELNLTGDFFTVGKILGYSLKGAGYNLESPGTLKLLPKVTFMSDLERKETVLEAYHVELFDGMEKKRDKRVTRTCIER